MGRAATFAYAALPGVEAERVPGLRRVRRRAARERPRRAPRPAPPHPSPSPAEAAPVRGTAPRSPSPSPSPNAEPRGAGAPRRRSSVPPPGVGRSPAERGRRGPAPRRARVPAAPRRAPPSGGAAGGPCAAARRSRRRSPRSSSPSCCPRRRRRAVAVTGPRPSRPDRDGGPRRAQPRGDPRRPARGGEAAPGHRGHPPAARGPEPGRGAPPPGRAASPPRRGGPAAPPRRRAAARRRDPGARHDRRRPPGAAPRRPVDDRAAPAPTAAPPGPSRPRAPADAPGHATRPRAVNRRAFLTTTGAASSSPPRPPRPPASPPLLRGGRFSEGVLSGDPTPDRHHARHPAGRGRGHRRGHARDRPRRGLRPRRDPQPPAHRPGRSATRVKARVNGLKPHTQYWYRFAGRTAHSPRRPLPDGAARRLAAGRPVRRSSTGLDYAAGYFNALALLARRGRRLRPQPRQLHQRRPDPGARTACARPTSSAPPGRWPRTGSATASTAPTPGLRRMHAAHPLSRPGTTARSRPATPGRDTAGVAEAGRRTAPGSRPCRTTPSSRARRASTAGRASAARSTCSCATRASTGVPAPADGHRRPAGDRRRAASCAARLKTLARGLEARRQPRARRRAPRRGRPAGRAATAGRATRRPARSCSPPSDRNDVERRRLPLRRPAPLRRGRRGRRPRRRWSPPSSAAAPSPSARRPRRATARAGASVANALEDDGAHHGYAVCSVASDLLTVRFEKLSTVRSASSATDARSAVLAAPRQRPASGRLIGRAEQAPGLLGREQLPGAVERAAGRPTATLHTTPAVPSASRARCAASRTAKTGSADTRSSSVTARGSWIWPSARAAASRSWGLTARSSADQGLGRAGVAQLAQQHRRRLPARVALEPGDQHVEAELLVGPDDLAGARHAVELLQPALDGVLHGGLAVAPRRWRRRRRAPTRRRGRGRGRRRCPRRRRRCGSRRRRRRRRARTRSSPPSRRASGSPQLSTASTISASRASRARDEPAQGG